MMRGLFAGCLAAFWLQFCHNLARKATPPAVSQEPADPVPVTRIIARWEAERRSCFDHDPHTVSRWVNYAAKHDVVIVVADSNRAIVPGINTAPRRVH